MGTRAPRPVVELDVALRRVLARNHLAARAWTGGVVGIADDVVGLHATSPTTPYLSLHARLDGFACADLDDAVYERQSLVRLKAMRGTVFLWSRRLAPLAFAATRAATVASDRRWLGTNDAVFARLAPKVLGALAGQSLSVSELRKTLGDDAEVSGVVAMLCDEGRIVRDRPVGTRASSTFRYRLWTDVFADVSLDEWDETAATQQLARLYVDSYGPVSRADIIWWTGLPARQIDAALEGLGDELLTVAVVGLGEDLLMTRSAFEETGTVEPGPVAVNLVPMLDPYTMAYRDRSRLLDPSLHDTVIDRGGNVTSVVLVDGRVAGVWDLSDEPTPAIRVLLFGPNHRQRRLVMERAAETGAFWFDAAVPVMEYTSMVPLRARSGVMRRPLDDARARSAPRSSKRARSPRAAASPPARTARRDSRSRTRGGTP